MGLIVLINFFLVSASTDAQQRELSDQVDFPQPQEEAKTSNDSTRMADLESYMDGLIGGLMKAEHVAGVTVSVVAGNQVVLSKGYGLANVQDGQTVSADKTRFQIASITKLFTWTAVMQLVEQGKLDLHTDVQEYLPELTIPKTYPEPITMRISCRIRRDSKNVGLGYLTVDKFLYGTL